MKYFLLAAVVLFYSATGFSQLIAKDLYQEFGKNQDAFESKYFGKQLTIQGVVFRVVPNNVYVAGASNNDHWVTFTGTGYEIFITCKVPYEQRALLQNINNKETYVVTGTYSEKTGNGMILTNCSFSKPAAAGQPVAKAKKVPGNIPFGKYNVYQEGGAGFAYQYALNLNSYTSYQVNNKRGSCTYDAKTKVIRFTSGSLKGFTGKYRPVNPNNENDPPTIVIDFNGKVPDLSKGAAGKYQYAYWKG